MASWKGKEVNFETAFPLQHVLNNMPAIFDSTVFEQ